MTSRIFKGYDGVADIPRTNNEQRYQVWFEKPTRLPMSLRQESLAAAKDLAATYPDKELMVLFSGGLDSEWICESLWTAGVKFTPTVMNNGANDHDLYWARRWCAKRGVTPYEHFFDLKSWYGSSEQFEIAANCQTTELAYTGQLKTMLDLNSPDRVFIHCYDEPGLVADDSGPERVWNLYYSERHYSVTKFLTHYGINSKPNGWIDTNLTNAFIRTPTMQMLVANLWRPQIWSSEMLKVKYYQGAVPSLEARHKYTGFENMLDVVVPINQQWKITCQERYGTIWMDDFSRPIKDVWRELEEIAQ